MRVSVQNTEDRLQSDLLKHSRDFLFDHLVRSLPIKGKQRFLSWLLPRAGETQALLHGLPYFRVDFSDWIQRCIYLGTYELTESRWVRSILRAGDTCIDVGANCGFYTSLFWSIVKPSGSVLAFEPNPTLYGRLTTWFKANCVLGVETYPAALGDQEGIGKLYLPPPTAQNNNATMTATAGSRAVDVDIWRLGDILRSRKLEKVRLMKIDVEGFECKVLRGAEKELLNGVAEYILIELNDYWLRRHDSSADQLLSYCRFLDYEIIKGRPPAPSGLSDLLLRHRRASS